MGLALRTLRLEHFPGGLFPLSGLGRTWRVGRDETCDLRLATPSVSSLHAKIVETADGYEVFDCDSSNGTFVNGERVERCRLESGDRLGIAVVEFWVEEMPSTIGAEVGSLVATQRINTMAALTREGATDPAAAREADGAKDREIENLREKVAQAEALQGQLAALEAAASDSEAALHEREAAIASLEERIRHGERDRRELQEQQLAGETLAQELKGIIQARDEEIRLLQRRLDDSHQSGERLASTLNESRRDLLAREGEIATLHYDAKREAEEKSALEGERSRLQGLCDEVQDSLDKTEERLRATARELEVERTARFEAESKADEAVRRQIDLGRRLLSDWKAWIGESEVEFDESDPEEVQSRVEALAVLIRGQLDRIEPIWLRFGDGVQGELADHCEALRLELRELGETQRLREEELAALEADLERFRECMDAELRRAQGLSRKGVEVEIPQRFEAMVIPRSRELEACRALIERIEELDRLLAEFPKSGKLAAIRTQFLHFRGRLHDILDGGGVESFEVEKGTVLSPAHRGEVQILARKGWGVRQYAEQAFQPGEVAEVVSPGYRLRSGGTSTVLRKVAVRIRGGED